MCSSDLYVFGGAAGQRHAVQEGSIKCLYTYMRMCMDLHICVCVCACVCVYICMYVYVCIYIYVSLYITCMCSLFHLALGNEDGGVQLVY